MLWQTLEHCSTDNVDFCHHRLVQPLYKASIDHREHLLPLDSSANYIKFVLEAFPFYSQCFLMVGMSFEHWVKVCIPHRAKEILSQLNQIVFYFIVLFAAVFVPVAFFGDHVLMTLRPYPSSDNTERLLRCLLLPRGKHV